jgi:hypothetical protein
VGCELDRSVLLRLALHASIRRTQGGVDERGKISG